MTVKAQPRGTHLRGRGGGGDSGEGDGELGVGGGLSADNFRATSTKQNKTS